MFVEPIPGAIVQDRVSTELTVEIIGLTARTIH